LRRELKIVEIRKEKIAGIEMSRILDSYRNQNHGKISKKIV
jgi:hypothetical protein